MKLNSLQRACYLKFSVFENKLRHLQLVVRKAVGPKGPEFQKVWKRVRGESVHNLESKIRNEHVFSLLC